MKLFFVFVFIFLVFLIGCIGKNCENLPKEYGQRDICFRKMAIEEKNEEICEKIEDEHLRDFWCFRHIAYLKKDFKICEKIKNEEAKESCIKILNGEERFEPGIKQ
jgi:hypothetical protein